MYYLFADTSDNDIWYCLANANTRTSWELALPLVLSKPFTLPVAFYSFEDATLLYSGPTIPTIDTHPELFI